MTARPTTQPLRVLIAALLVGTLLVSTATAGRSHRQVRSGEASPVDVSEAEQLLAELGYWTGPIDGTWDAGTRHAVIALQKVAGLPRTGSLSDAVLGALRARLRPEPREAGYPHVEVDLGRQILFVVDDAGAVSHVLPISSGSGRLYAENGVVGRAFTPRGRFVIERKIAGWRRSPLGLLYYPNYFHKGWAIHGNPSVPVTPASHGCIRIPMFAAVEFGELAPVGMVVLVYE